MPIQELPETGDNRLTFSQENELLEHIFYKEHALAYPQPQFSAKSGPTKQLSWQPPSLTVTLQLVGTQLSPLTTC